MLGEADEKWALNEAGPLEVGGDAFILISGFLLGAETGFRVRPTPNGDASGCCEDEGSVEGTSSTRISGRVFGAMGFNVGLPARISCETGVGEFAGLLLGEASGRNEETEVGLRDEPRRGGDIFALRGKPLGDWRDADLLSDRCFP